MSFSKSDKPEFVNLKSIFDDRSSSQQRSFSKHLKRRAPLPPRKGEDVKTIEARSAVNENMVPSYSQLVPKVTYTNKEQNFTNLQIIEGDDNSKKLPSSNCYEKDFDVNSQLQELEIIAKCYNNLKTKLEKSTNPFDEETDDNYDETKNPFHDETVQEELDEKNPFCTRISDAEVSRQDTTISKQTLEFSNNEINDVEKPASEIVLQSAVELEGVELRKQPTSKIPKRTLSVNSEESDKKISFQRNGDVRRSVGTGTKAERDKRDKLSRTNSDGNRDTLETLKKPWTRVSAKFKREPLNLANKGPGRGTNNRSAYRKNLTKIQVGIKNLFVSCFTVNGSRLERYLTIYIIKCRSCETFKKPTLTPLRKRFAASENLTP